LLYGIFNSFFIFSASETTSTSPTQSGNMWAIRKLKIAWGIKITQTVQGCLNQKLWPNTTTTFSKFYLNATVFTVGSGRYHSWQVLVQTVNLLSFQMLQFIQQYSDTSANEWPSLLTNFSANKDFFRCFSDSANEYGFG
jgi:hypothetical protein